MPRLSKVFLVILFVIVVCSIAIDSMPGDEAQAPPRLREIPGVTAPDPFPSGCVDCHVNRPDLKMDVRISTFMRQWQDKVAPAFLDKVRAFAPADMPLKGRHPEVEWALADIPNACLKCHSETSKSAPPFGRLLHGLHLVGGEKNHFLSMFQGECTHCHKLDAATGLWSLGSGAEK